MPQLFICFSLATNPAKTHSVYLHVSWSNVLRPSIRGALYPTGSSLLSTHQLGGFAGAKSGASLQAFPSEYQWTELPLVSVSALKHGASCISSLEYVSGAEFGRSTVSCSSWRPTCPLMLPHVLTCVCSIFVAISRRRESVWLQVHQSDASRQPGWLDPQRECQSSLPGNFSLSFPRLLFVLIMLVSHFK